MVIPSAGSVVIISFPFSDLTASKLRLTSFVRTGKLFTANQILFQGSAGLLYPEKFSEIITSITKIINSSLLK